MFVKGLVVLFLLSTMLVPAVNVQAEVNSRATVLNTAPTLDSFLSPDDDPATPGVQVINNNPNTNKMVTIIVNVSDDNGWDDVASVTAEITGPSVVEDSPVNLNFDSAVNITTAIYKGSFSMSDHLEGDYKVEVTATDAGGLSGTNSRNFTYAICKLPDLVITDVWNVGNRIYYNITNIGNAPAPRSLSILRVDGRLRGIDLVRRLNSGESSTESFRWYRWYRWRCSPPGDTITVCADFRNRIDECNETNNCRRAVWSCR